MNGSPMTVARKAVADVLRADEWNVYTSAPEVSTLPSAITTAGDPWYAAGTWGMSDVSLIVTVCGSQAGGNEAAVERLEDAVWRLILKFRAAGYAVGPLVSPPRQVTFGQAEALCADIPVRVRVADDAPSQREEVA